MNVIKLIAMILVIVGALNWGLVGLLDLDLVKLIFREAMLIKVVYILVGVAGLLVLLDFAKITKAD